MSLADAYNLPRSAIGVGRPFHPLSSDTPPPMLTREEDEDAHALHAKGWRIAAIARHLGRDRKTIWAYLNGDRFAGEHSTRREPLSDRSHSSSTFHRPLLRTPSGALGSDAANLVAHAPCLRTKLRSLIDSGATLASLAALLHAAPGTVSRWLAEIGVGEPDHSIDRIELRRLYVDQQLTVREVGDRLGVPKNRIIRELALADIPRRSRHSRRPRVARVAVTDERLNELYVNRGLTPRSAWSRLWVYEGYLRRRLREAGITNRPGTFGSKPAASNRLVARACLLYDGGLTMAAVAAELGVSATQVALILTEAGVPVRPPGPRPLNDDQPTRRVLTQLYDDTDVRQALERWNIPVRDPESWDRPSAFQILAPDPLLAELLRHLYCDLGLTIHHISILCGIGTTGVTGQLQRLGITLRPPGASPWTRRNTRR